MPIGTSNGEYFEDSFDQAHTEMFGAKGTYDPKTDTFVADTEPTPKEIYFVRHGDTDLNKEGEKSNDRAPVRGWNNTPLNDQGRADAQKAADKLSKEPITHIVTSDLPRASETASIIGDKLGITPEEHPGLRTWNLGEYTGKTGEEVHDAVDRLCLHQPDVRPPGGESFNEFKDRILSTFGEIARDHAEHEVLVVSHNSPERILNAWHEAGQPASREIDRKSYHADDGAIDPGQHKKFTINNVDALNRPSNSSTGIGATSFGMMNETGWMEHPTFNERWEGTKTTEEIYNDVDRAIQLSGGTDIGNIQWYLRNKNKPPEGWTANQFPQSAPSLQEPNFMKYPGPGAGPKGRGPSLGWQGQPIFPSTGSEMEIMPYNPDRPEHRDYRISMKDKPYDVIAKQSTQLEGGGTSGRIGATTTGDPILGYAQQGLGVKDIAEKLGLHRNTVNYWLNKLGFPRNQNIAKGVDWEKFDTLLKDGKTIAQATQEMGLSQDAYYARQSRLRAQEKKSEPSLPKLDIQKKDLPEQDQDYINELSKWMKNQFEGGPTEKEWQGILPPGAWVPKGKTYYPELDNRLPWWDRLDMEKKAANQNFFVKKGHPSYESALMDQRFNRTAPENIRSYKDWQTAGEDPNGYVNAREASRGNKYTTLIDSRNKRHVWFNGVKLGKDQ